MQESYRKESWAELALDQIRSSIDTKEKLAESCVGDIVDVGVAMASTLKDGSKVVFFGNGGSAADAQHLAAELVGQFSDADRPPLRAVALTTNSSVLTAVGNDFGFDQVFSRQIVAHVDPGDMVVGISTSGRSKNVIDAMEEAKRIGATTVALTGGSGREFAELCDYHIIVPSTDTQRIQECHITIGHILCAIVDKSIPHVYKVRKNSTSRIPRRRRIEAGLRSGMDQH